MKSVRENSEEDEKCEGKSAGTKNLSFSYQMLTTLQCAADKTFTSPFISGEIYGLQGDFLHVQFFFCRIIKSKKNYPTWTKCLLNKVKLFYIVDVA